ncbi:pheromone A receptor-domain-containing protein [Bisporella sp. PMI_857]|nr:pheromone A receptor-domain-containing protein [Bisporella sp. PMI_857]
MDLIDPDPSTMSSPSSGPYRVAGNTIAVSTVSGLLILSNVVPFLSLYSAKQIPACTIIIVTDIILFFTFINAIIWPTDNFATWWNGAGLCDIEVILRSVFATLIESATCCLTRNLSIAVDVDNNPRLFETTAMRRRRLMGELVLCFGIPFFQLVFHYFIQSGRYAIVTVYGCTDVIDNSWVTVFLFLIWPVIFTLMNLYYAVLVLIRLRRHRGNLSSTLSSSGSRFTARRFMKLYFICILFFVIQLPPILAFFYFNLKNFLPLQQYSWSQAHDPKVWPLIIYFTAKDYPLLQYYGWPATFLGLAIFIFYGMNKEAIERYRAFVVFIGLGKFWPSLKQPMESRRRGSTSRTSWISKIDLVGKAVRYCDSSRKHSHTSTGLASQTPHSRKGSTGTFNLSNITSTRTSSALHKSSVSPDSAIAYSHHDAITPAPSNTHLATTATTGEHSHPRQPRYHRPLLSFFGTHINFPSPIFSRRGADTNDIDIEASPHIRHPSMHGASTNLDDRNLTVETNIWSGRAFNPEIEEGEAAGASSPKLGTRTYRERERCELERYRATERSGAMSEDVHAEARFSDGVTISRSLDQVSTVMPSQP